MGDYTILSGTVQIKPELIEKLRPRFTRRKVNDDRLSWELKWEELDLPEEIKATVAFRTLAHPCSMGDSVPGYNTLDHEDSKMELSETGLFEFNCGRKNSSCGSLRAFIALLPHIATSWDVSLDFSEFVYAEDGPIENYSSEKDPTLKEFIDSFEKYAWLTHPQFLLEENKDIVSRILQRVGSYGGPGTVLHKQLHVIRTDAGIVGAVTVPRDYVGNGLPMAIMLANSTNKRMVLIVEIDHVLDTIKAVFPGITKEGEAHVFDTGYFRLVSNPEQTLITYAKQYIADGTIPS